MHCLFSNYYILLYIILNSFHSGGMTLQDCQVEKEIDETGYRGLSIPEQDGGKKGR